MNSSYDMDQRKGEAFSRSSLLWVIATALVAIATMLTPGLALAEENSLLPQGNLTLDANPEGTSVKNEAPSVSSSNNAAITSDAAASTSKTDSAATSDATTEVASNASDSNSAASNSNTSTNEIDASNKRTEDADSIKSTKNNSEEAAKTSTSNDSSCQVKEINEPESSKTTKTTAKDSSSGDESAVNSTKESGSLIDSAGSIVATSNTKPSDASKAAPIAKSPKSSDIKTQDTFKVTFVFGGHIDRTDDGKSYTASMLSPSLSEVFLSDKKDGSSYEDAEGNTYSPNWANTEYNGSFTTYTYNGYSYPAVTLNLDSDDLIPTNIYRMGYDFIGWWRPSINDYWMWSTANELTEDELAASYLLIATWHPQEDYNLYVNITNTTGDPNDQTYIHNEGTGKLWFESVTLPAIDSSNAATYGYSLDSSGHVVDGDDSYEFAGYVLNINNFYKYNEGKCYVVGDDDSYGPIPVVSAGTYSFGNLYYALIGGTFPGNRWYPSNENYPFELIDPSGERTIFDQQLTIRAVFKKVAATPTAKYDVTYNNTTAAGATNGQTATVTGKKSTYTVEDPSDSTWTYSAFTKPSDYHFAGWATSAANAAARTIALHVGDPLSSLSGLGTSTSAANPVALFAVWEADTYTVRYFVNDGSTATPVTFTLNVADKGTDTVKSDSDLSFSNSGYNFNGWTVGSASSTTTAAAGDLMSTLIPVKDGTIDLYAQWLANEFTINYVYNGGKVGTSSGPSNGNTYTPGVTTLTGVPAVKKTGSYLDGWSDASGAKVVNSDGTVVAGGSIATATAGSTHTLTAIWKYRTYTINWWKKWSSTGSYSASDSMIGATTFTYGNTSSISATDPYPLTAGSSTATSGSDTYQFQGWYLAVGSGNWDTPATGITALSAADSIASALAVAGVRSTDSASDATGTLTILAVWKKLGSFNLVFNTNYPSATGITSTSTTKTVTQGNNFAFSTVAEPTVSGYTFAGWKDIADSNVYKAGTAKDTLNSVQKQHVFDAQWTPNTVNFVLNDGATDTSINLHGKTNPSAKVEATVQGSDLTSATPTRDGYDFLGWARSAAADGDASGVIIGGPSAKTYVIVPGDAPSDPTTMNLFAVWGPTKYQVWYDANPKSGDTKNSVTFKKGSSTVSSPYQYTSTATASDPFFDTPDITAHYGDASGDWYEFKGWSTTPGGTTPIAHNATIKDLFIDPAPASAKPTSSTHNTLYAIWKAVTFDVSYDVRDTNGTVSNAGPYTIDLATGTTVTTSTANPNTGYAIATPNTWTDASGNAVSVTGAGTATIAPTISDLRALKTAGNTSYTFYANFTAGSYGYEVQAFMEDASGAYPTTYTWRWTMPGGQSLKASYGSTVRATDTLTSGTYSGKALRDLPLVDTSKWTSSIDNAKLYVFDSANANNVPQISSISDNTANNVLKVYFKRRTFDLTSAFKTINKTVANDGTVNSTTIAGAPSGFTGTSEANLNGGAATTGLRWGQSISVTSPTYAGYNFSWAVTTPTSATSTAPGTSFALSAADMAAAYDANNASPKAELTGTFDVILYTVTLTDPDPNSTHNWTRGGASNTAASALQTAKTVSRQVAHDGTLGSWVPDTTDSSTYTYYFAGWYRSDDVSQTVISSSTLAGVTPWTADVTYVAKWLPKVVVTYDQGDNDSFGNPKAGWSSKSISLSKVTTSDMVGTKAPFETVVGSGTLVGGKPKAADGWEFDYWTIEGSTVHYGHDSALPGTSQYVAATDANGFNLGHNYTFIAHWKALSVKVVVNNAGPVRNNGTVNTDTITATLPTVSKTYSTDDVLDLADYQPTTVPAGYTHVGWKDAAGHTYGTTGTFHLTKDGITLTPIFDEKTVKVSYKLATNSASKGSITGTSEDTVYAVKHNGVTAHTATSTDSKGYDFVSWTDADNAAGNRVDTTSTTGALAVADVKALLDAAGVLAADKTYYANFKTNQYTITFSPDGTDGTNDYSNTTVATGTHGNGNNDFKVDWNTKIDNPGDSVAVTVPLGFKQDGWVVTVVGTGATSSISGTSADLYGAYNYTVKDDVVLKAHFVADTGANFTVNYSYDPEGISSFSGSTPSNTVAWGGPVLPTVAGDLNPVQSGYTFEGWYAQYTAPAAAGAAGTYTTKVDTTDGKFGTIYNLLVAAGASAPNLVKTSPQSITIYAKWTAKTFGVIFDTFGNVADDASTTADDPNQTTIANRSAKWNDKAGTFWIDPTSGTLTRPGYTLTGWSATYTTTGSGTTQSRASVASGDTYAVLAGNAEANAPVTLHAIWTAQSYNVTYDYNDATIMGGTKTPDATGKYQWTQSRDYYNDPSGNVPSRTGWHFDGWKVSFKGSPSAGASMQTMNGTTITGHGSTTMHDLMQGHAEGLATDPVMTLTAQWTQESSYQWQDVLVHLDGTTENGTLSSSNTVAGNSSVAFTSYGTPKTSYEGYDFDNHVASNPNFTTATATSITVTAGSSMIYKVYYLERGYTIQYYKEATDLTYTDSTSDNPYTSDTVKLPTSTPTKAGYTFKGWQLVDPASGAGAIAGDITTATGAARKISDVLTTAPAAGTILKAVAKFEENKATITWKADTNGTVSPSDNSVSIDATTGTFSTGSGTTIKAVPNTNFDFEGWYANYNGPAGTVNEKVTSASPYVRLTESTPGSGIYDTIEPIKWTQTAGGTPIWSTITFTAKFVVSSSLTVTIDHYVEDATNGTWNKTTVTDRSATDGTSYTAAPMPGLPSGYTKNSSVTVPATYPAYKETGTINAAVPASLHFVLYYTADLNNVSYQYVDASGNVTTSVPATAPVLSTLSGVGSHKTGTTFTVEAKPSVTGYTFTGWYVQGDASKTDVSGTPMTMAGKDIVLVGTWEIAHYTVNFINAPSTDQAVIDGCTVTQQTGGYTVDYNQPVSSKVGSISATASLPDVSWHEQGSHTLVGWDKLIDGVVTGSPLGITDPLSEVVTSNVTFRARWANTYDVQYTRGDHGTFKDFTNTKTFIDWSSLPIGTVIDPGYTFTATTGHVGYNGTTEATSGHENYGNPKAADGWAFVGWGWNDGSKWNYSFADDPDIDYGVFKTGSSDVNGVAMPASLTGTETATGNITFVGFYKRMERTVVFSDKQFDASKGVGSGVESTVAWSPAANFASGTTTSYTYKTGKDVSMLPATSISREGYELVGWTPDGSATYTAGGTTTYQLPELAQGTTLYLYPVWQVKKLDITYDVATDSTGWGTVSNHSDARNLATDVIQGSTPNAGNGYVFDYWTKDSDTAHLTSAEGLATDGSNKLVPTESGHYHAHFKQKDYNLTYVADPADTTPAVTLPTTPLPANQHWTDSVNLEAASRTGYDFNGWDIYKSSDWTASGNSATPIHTGVMDGAHAISALSNGDGSATNLTLVATWKKATLGLTYHLTAPTGASSTPAWSTTDGDYPASEPATNRAAAPAAKIDHQINDVVDLRGAATAKLDGYKLVGWMDKADGSGTSYVFDAAYATAHGLTVATTLTMPGTSVDLYPIWDAKTYDVTFDPGAGVTASDVTNMPGNVTGIAWGDPVTTRDAAGDPKRTGYAFKGWTIKDKNGNVLRNTDAATGHYNAGSSNSDLYSTLAGVDTDDTASLTLVANWDQNTYTVKYQPGTTATVTGMPTSDWTGAYAGTVPTPAPTRAGYTFDGWTGDHGTNVAKTETSKGYDALAGSDSVTTVTLTAKWVANPHTLTYVKGSGDTWSTTAGDYPVSEPAANGAANPTAAIATETDAVIDLRQGSTLSQPGATLKGWTDGTNSYVFDAAYATAHGLTVVTTLTMPDADVTLTPIWNVAGDYAVHFHDGVTAGTTPVTTGTMPSDWTGAYAGTVPTPAPTRAGYTFGGWSSDQGSTYDVAATDATKAYSALVSGSSVKLVNLTAVWTANPHTLTYVKGSGDAWSTTASDYPATEPAANGAANPTAAIATATDASHTLRGASSLTQPGATLTGWNTKADGSGTPYALDATITMGDADLVLYPVWNVAGDYAVHFHDGVTAGTTPVTTGTMPSDWTGAYAGTVPTPAPTRAGYTFGGWSSDQGSTYDVAATDATKAYSALVSGSSVKLVNLTAKWVALTDYEVTYLVNAPAGQTYTGATVPVPSNRTNITFDQNDIKQTALADADMPGFTFGGWIVSKADGTELTRVTSGYATDAVYSALAGSDASIKRLVFTAIWNGKPLNVTYVLTTGEGTWVPANIADAGASNPAAAITYHAGDSVTLRDASTVKRAGYRLVGWKDDATTPNTYIFDSTYATAHGLARVNGFTMGTVDVVLVPIWDAKNYTVTFVDKPVSDTGTQAVTTMPTPNPWTGAYDEDVSHTAAVRTGYTFGGWDVYKTSDYTANASTAVALRHVGAGVDAYGVLAADPDIDALTLVASWTADHYTLTYVLITGEGDWVKAKITDGGAATPAAALGHDTDDQFGLRKADTVYYAGHTLLGWKDSNSPTVTPNEYRFGTDGTYTFTMPAKNVLLYPIWETSDDYTVTFDGNAPTTHVVPGTAVLNLPANQPISPARLTWEGATSNVDTHAPLFDGWTFVGWTVYDSDNKVVASTDATHLLGTLYQFNVLAGNVDTAARHHLKLVANWQLLPYTVVFKDGVNAGETAVTTGSMPADWTGAFDDDVNHTAPTRLGYTFDGWTVSDVTDPNNPVTLIGASDAGKPASGTTAYNVLAGSNAARRALEMTATWVKKALYNIHFVDKPATDTGATAVNMGGLTDISGMTWDQQFNAGPAPTRTGYTFDHWAVTNTTDPSDGSNTSDPALVKAIGKATVGSYHYSDLAIDRLTGNKDDTIYHITMTAVWVANKHTLTYVRADGTATTDYTWVTRNITDSGKATPDAAMTKNVDDAIDLRGATTVTRKGYTLTGWANGTDATATGYVAYIFANGDMGFSMPDADVTLYPLWAAKTYTVVYDANKPAGATDASQVVTGVPTPNPATGLGWTSSVDASHPSLLGYTFDGWVVKDAATTGALTGTLARTSYTFDELAILDTTDHDTLTLVANWLPAKYRLTYVDPVDASGATLATPVQISTDANKLWSDVVDATTNPISGTTPWYAGKTTADWQFDGWQVYDASTGAYRTLTASDDTHYGVLAALENLTLADVATANADPALVLYAKWTRRVPFVVDFVKRTATGNVVEDSTTLTGLDGDDIATTWKGTVLDLGDGHAIIGYAYNRTDSEPGMTGTLSAGTTLHLSLLYDPLTDYMVTYDANPGTNAAGATTATAAAPQWESVDSGFAPVDSDWHYLGHKIDHWFYKGSDGVEHTFDATDGKTFADIAAIIYGTVDGTEGRDLNGDGTIEKPVTIYAAWVERNDYVVKYDDNYDPANNGIPSQFLGRPGASYFTPADRNNMAWSATGLEPTDTTGTIVEPGVTGGDALYVQDGWNYSPDGGATQYAAEGKSFAEIAQAMYGTSEPTAGAIVLYARWKEIQIQLTYAPVIATVDADGKFQAVTGTNAGGTVSRASETVSAVTGGTTSGTDLKAAGATATAANGYHFIGWRRVSDGTVIYAPGYAPTTSSAKAARFARFAPRRAPAAATGTGFNVLPDGTIDATTIFSVAQNASDGYWHGEDYQALFVENDPAILHYNKNADDATGTIADVTKPYGTLITLDSGTEDATATTDDGFRRAHWKLTGWNTEADGSGTTYALSQGDWVMPEGETTLYAMWEKVMGRLIYDKNAKDATGTIADVVKQGGTVITLDSGTEDTTADTTDGFHRAHYVLVGWNTKADYTGTHYDLSESGWVMPDGTTTLYAEWQKMKYEISGPEGTKVTIPESGDGTKTTGGTTDGTTGTKIDGGYIKGGDTTKIEYGEPIPSGWIEAIPEEGKHVDHWTYVWIDEDGTKHTETADDPTKFTVKGKGTITPVFVDDPVEEPETPATTDDVKTDESTTTTGSTTGSNASKGQSGNRQAAYKGERSDKLPQTSDESNLALPFGLMGLGAFLIVLAAKRRKDEEDAEA